MNKKMYVDVTEVCEDWGVSRAQGYKIIKQLNERMPAINPNLIVLSGKANRKFYEGGGVCMMNAERFGCSAF